MKRLYSGTLSGKNKAAARAFGQAVKEARKELGLKQAQLASAMGLKRSTVANAETRGSSPYSSTFFAYCEYLGLEPEEFDFEDEAEEIIKQWRKWQTTGARS